MSAAIDDAPRNNQFDAPTIARVWYFISGLMITVNGLIFVGNVFSSATPCSGSSNCVGPALFWGSW